MTFGANIIIAYLDGENAVIEKLSVWKGKQRLLILPTVAEAEVLSFSRWTPQERERTMIFLEEYFASVPFDRQIAHIAARIRRDTKIKFPDAAIAATALFTHTPLVTRNVRDFKRITELEVITL